MMKGKIRFRETVQRTLPSWRKEAVVAVKTTRSEIRMFPFTGMITQMQGI